MSVEPAAPWWRGQPLRLCPGNPRWAGCGWGEGPGLGQAGRGCFLLGPASSLPGGALSASLSPQPDASMVRLTSLFCFRFQVVFGKKLPTFATIPIHQLQHEKKYDIYFADGKVFALYR